MATKYTYQIYMRGKGKVSGAKKKTLKKIKRKMAKTKGKERKNMRKKNDNNKMKGE